MSLVNFVYYRMIITIQTSAYTWKQISMAWSLQSFTETKQSDETFAWDRVVIFLKNMHCVQEKDWELDL